MEDPWCTNNDTLNPDEAPKAIVIRSLRRRFWKAVREEDGSLALSLYRATVGDWKEMIRSERKVREKSIGKIAKRSSLKGLIKRGSPKDSSSTDFRPTEPKIDPSVRLLQKYMNPSDPFTFDDFKTPWDTFGPEVEKIAFRPPPVRRTRKTARQALQFWNRRSDSQDEATDIVLDAAIDSRMTTPLHEAARLGHAELVQQMLKNPAVDPKMKNGVGRGVLQMAAGGILAHEIKNPLDDIGIFKPEPVIVDSGVAQDDTKANKPTRKLNRRIFQSSKKPPEAENQSKPKPVVVCLKQKDILDSARAETVSILLNWRYPNDGSARAGDTFSVNAVDDRGRTALHYAAELGRNLLCEAILDKFGMLTIVDDQNKTPCDLASANSHEYLANTLEARALLYMDPYGMDEILLASVLSNDPHAKTGLAPPFGWFRTIDMTRVQEVREHRVNAVLKNMKKILIARAENEEVEETVLNSCSRSESPAPASNPDDSATEELGVGALKEDSNYDDEGQPVKSEYGNEDGLNEVEEDIPETELEESETESSLAHEALIIPSDEGVLSREDSNSTLGTLELAQLTENDLEEENKLSTDDIHKFDKLHKCYAEAYLRYHGWQVKEALVSFLEDPILAFSNAGVALPEVDVEVSDAHEPETQVCSICFDDFELGSKSWRTLNSCSHGFCVDCLGGYIDSCAKGRETGLAIPCPYHKCGVPMAPLETVNLSPTTDVYSALIDASNQNFIAAAKDIKYCPHPSCDGIVKLSLPDRVKKYGGDIELLGTIGAVCSAVRPKVFKSPVTYEGVCDQSYMDSHKLVQPPRSHRFCFACSEEGTHWPVSCERLEQWKDVIREHEDEVRGEGGGGDYNEIAQRLWMKTNTKPCPKCKAPIEKDEGCNHMTCCNPHCKHEFCWICRKDWRSHNTDTGGYFRCNRWVDLKEHDYYDKPPDDEAIAAATAPTNDDLSDPRTMEATYGTSMHQTRVTMKRSREMGRFLHHYQRWNAHAESAELEQRLSESVCTRMRPVVHAAIQFSNDPSFNFGGKGLSFVYAAFFELAECRSMLRHSYAFSYFRYGNFPSRSRHGRAFKRLHNEKTEFEQNQAELETLTEQMSDVVARSRLRATQSQITYLTSSASAKRREFSSIMASIGLQERKEAEFAVEAASQGGDAKKSQASLSAIAGQTSFDDESNDGMDLAIDDDAIGDAIRASLQDLTDGMGSASLPGHDLDDDDIEIGDWACSACTFVNSRGRSCEICGTNRA